MINYGVRRLGAVIPLLLAVSVISFAIIQLVPGSPVQALLFGTDATPAQAAALTKQLGLDRPVVVQYFTYLGHLLQGDLGRSYLTQTTVSSEVFARLGSTIQLAAAAMLVACLLGAPLGMLGALRAGTVVGRVSVAFATLWSAIPYFWFALLLVEVFAIKLGWLPAVSDGTARSLILPAVSLGLSGSALIARLLRASMLDVLGSQYVTYARMRGIPPRRILLRTVTRGACGPAVTGIGVQLGSMLSGTAATEIIFGRSGAGSLFVTSILSKDIPMVQGLTLVLGGLYILINFGVDMTKAALDPRVRAGLAGVT